jgi:hypothetical protein
MRQLFAHNETLLSQLLASQRGQVELYQGLARAWSEQRAQLESERIELWGAIRSLVVEDLAERSRQDRNREIAANLGCLVRAVAYRITGGAVHEQGSPLSEALNSLARSITPEQLTSLQSILSPAQQALLATLFDERGGPDATSA